MASIEYFQEDTNYLPSNPSQLTQWLLQVASRYDQEIAYINYIFCSDNYLLQVNQEYLDHDYYTDIITFDQRDNPDEPIEADIFISIDRVNDNATKEQAHLEEEVHRVMIHGLLHLIGFDDKTTDQKEEMRKTEDACLSLLHN